MLALFNTGARDRAASGARSDPLWFATCQHLAALERRLDDRDLAISKAVEYGPLVQEGWKRSAPLVLGAPTVERLRFTSEMLREYHAHAERQDASSTSDR